MRRYSEGQGPGAVEFHHTQRSCPMVCFPCSTKNLFSLRQDRPFFSGSNACFPREITGMLSWTFPAHVEIQTRKWDESLWQKSLQFDPTVRKHRVLNSWKMPVSTSRVYLWCVGDFYSCLGLGFCMIFQNDPLALFSIASHTGKKGLEI